MTIHKIKVNDATIELSNNLKFDIDVTKLTINVWGVWKTHTSFPKTVDDDVDMSRRVLCTWKACLDEINNNIMINEKQ